MVPALAGLFVGLLISLQSRVNASFSEVLDSGVHAATISFVIGALTLSLLMAISSRLRIRAQKVFRALLKSELPWWNLVGGAFGAVFVIAQTYFVGPMGVALFAIGIVAGLTTTSFFLDALGNPYSLENAVSFGRIAAVLMGIVAVLVGSWGRYEQSSISTALLIASIFVGAGAAVQQRLNGRVAAVADSAIVSGWLNFLVGSTVLAVVVLVISPVRTGSINWDLDSQWWVLSGGFIGVTFISLAAWAVNKLGVLRLSLLSVVGQLIGAVILDYLFTDYIDPWLLIGICIAISSAFLAHIGRKSWGGKTQIEQYATE